MEAMGQLITDTEDTVVMVAMEAPVQVIKLQVQRHTSHGQQLAIFIALIIKGIFIFSYNCS